MRVKQFLGLPPSLLGLLDMGPDTRFALIEPLNQRSPGELLEDKQENEKDDQM